MLGVRLDAEFDRRLTALARRQRRSKSDIAREALQAYITREDDQAEFVRQVQAIADWEAANPDPEEDAFMNALVAEALDDDDLADLSFVRPPT